MLIKAPYFQSLKQHFYVEQNDPFYLLCYFNVTLNLSQVQVTLYLSDRQQTLTVPQEIWHSDEQDD